MTQQIDVLGTDVASFAFFDRALLEGSIWSSFAEDAGLSTALASSQTSNPVSHTVTLRRVTAGNFWLSGRGLRRPLRVHVDVSAPDEFTASEPQTGIFGVGSHAGAALEDLRLALVEHRDVLASSGTLSEDLERQRDVLDHYLQP